jgi:hypothetical protein
MRTSTSKRTRRTITVALASVLLAAPAAQARFDEGAVDARRTSQPAVRSVDADGFSWADAGIGAGAALAALLAAGGTGYAVRRRSLPLHS